MRKDTKYYINREDEFVIENYNQAKPFSSFLPAIAGLYGRPMWVYYVNRGQCIATFGINNKDYSIMEFQPANKAYRQTSLQGFRTFMKVKYPGEETPVCYEPFKDLNLNKDYDVVQKMYITSYDLKIEEINNTLGIKTEVMFCTLPGENMSGLIRTVRITDISQKDIEIEVLDGMPVIIPYYLIDKDMKNESNLRQAWMGVDNYGTIPFYKIKVLPYDTAETVFVEGGNFYLNFGAGAGNKINISKTIIDPGLIFGNVTDMSYPEGFFETDFEVPLKQVDVGVTPCGFGYKKIALAPGAGDTTYTLIGNSDKYEKLTGFVENTLNENYIIEKINENKRLIESLKSNIFTVSSCREFDLYSGQTFMDNFLRGGYPIELGNGRHVFYVYSRKHGDLEREYNFFQVDATNYSQGNSNFRDVNQNRRNDTGFFPYIGDSNIKTFFNLLQLDGFNPLVLKGAVFKIEDMEKAEQIAAEYFGESSGLVTAHFQRPFTPGSLLGTIDTNELKVKKGTLDEFVNDIFALAAKSEIADFHEGYWADHWTYNNDLLEQYMAVFPDKIQEMLLDTWDYTYFDSCMTVAPRDRKYVLTGSGVRQFDALIKLADKEKLIRERNIDKYKVRMDFGKGEIYKCNLASKIVGLLVNKMASLDPEGVGIEMESNKPGWCDALNGMPGILGSSINESAEVKRLALILLDMFNNYKLEGYKGIKVPEEVYGFFAKVYLALKTDMSDFAYWDFTYKAKEEYRDAVASGISGIELEIDAGKLKSFLKYSISKINSGLEKAFNSKDGLHYTYFINEVVEYDIIEDGNGRPACNPNGYPYVKAKRFKQRPIPYFLEGPVHILRTGKNGDEAREIYASIRKTGLYDEKLKMHRVNDNIMHETREIGRQNVFPRGWLENEAIFLHMEYKYLLELLRCGLYDEFFTEMKNSLIPFLDPAVYGRSILENSSFIASSAHPNEKLHGTGYQSRLSGASAEFLNMWLYMTAGSRPFYAGANGELCLKFEPALPEWLFTKDAKEIDMYRNMEPQKIKLPPNSFAFNFLGSTLAVYHNDGRKNTFGEGAAEISRYRLTMRDGSSRTIKGEILTAPLAEQIRAGLADRIDIFME